MNPALIGVSYLRMSSGVKITVDGNSIYTTVGSTSSVAALLAANAYLGGVVTTVDCAVSGQTWQNMIDTPSDIDAAYDASKINVLICGESANSSGNRDGAGIAADAAIYIARAKSVSPTRKVVLCSGMPRGGNASASNQRILDGDALMRANWRSYGADAFCDFRAAGYPLAFDGATSAPFTANLNYWQEATDWLHLTELGKNVCLVPPLIATLKKLRKR